MNSQFRITIPGKPWVHASQGIQEDIKSANDSNADFPIIKIFDYITLTDANRDLENKIMQRGDFKKQADGNYLNRGTPIAQAVHDVHQEIGRLAIHFPREVSLTVSDNLRLSVDISRRRQIVLSFRDKPPTAGFGRRFTLVELLFEDNGVSYSFTDQSDTSRLLILFVDFYEEPQRFPEFVPITNIPSLHSLSKTRGVQFASIVASEAFADGACTCSCCLSPPFEPACKDPGGKLAVRIHAKILFTPNVEVDTQVAAVNTVYGEQIECILASIENLDTVALGIERLVDYDSGKCATRGETGELAEISKFRDGASKLEIVVYWVRSITSTKGSLAGCATSLPDRPNCVLSQTASKWVLAHELGHVLGLRHPCELPNCPEEYRSRLMYPSDMHNGTPTINADELRTMRCSGFTLSN